MGKRELFIALAFVAAGVVAYQLTAPPPPPGAEGFSFGRFWTNARRGMRGSAAQATFTKTGSIPVGPGLAELRIEGVTRQVRLIGESRPDIAYELTVESTGPDYQTALGYAKQVTVKTDDLGTALTLRVGYPRNERQAATVVLHVPARLGVLLSGSNGVDASTLASLHLDNVAGDAAVSGVTGALTGLHRNGYLKVRDIGSVKLTLRGSRASFENVQHGLTLDLRDGECRIAASKGPIELDEMRVEVTVVSHAGPIRIGGNDGRITLSDPRDVSKVDVRRAEVEVSLLRPVSLTLLTTDDTLRLLLDGPAHVALDAAASLGRVHAEDFQLSPESDDQESRLTHTFGAGDARVSLRDLRGDIVIRNLRGSIVNPRGK
jgi:hypothetical protein